MQQRDGALHDAIVTTKPGLFTQVVTIDNKKLEKITPEQMKIVEPVLVEAKQGTLGLVAVLPAIMCVCYLILIGYFRSKGGYEAQVLTGHQAKDEEYTGGVPAPMEA
jgi:hypothetical protein